LKLSISQMATILRLLLDQQPRIPLSWSFQYTEAWDKIQMEHRFFAGVLAGWIQPVTPLE